MKGKILVIDDETDVIEFLETLIIKEGFQPLSAKTADEAIPLIENQQPDLILLDLILPKKSGIEVLNYLKTKNINTPVIIITGKYDEEKLRRSLLTFYNVEDYIIKPIHMDYLSYLIHKILGTKPKEIGRKKLEFE